MSFYDAKLCLQLIKINYILCIYLIYLHGNVAFQRTYFLLCHFNMPALNQFKHYYKIPNKCSGCFDTMVPVLKDDS